MIYKKQFAIVKDGIESKTQHFIGLPPEVTANPENAMLLPKTKIVILIDEEDGYYLNRFASDGRFSGDTFHYTEKDAKEQAEFEFNIKSTQWIGISRDIKDEKSHAFDYLREKEMRKKLRNSEK